MRKPEPEITDYNYMASAIGNAYYSGIEFWTLWECIYYSQTPESVDQAVSAAIEAKEWLDDILKKP